MKQIFIVLFFLPFASWAQDCKLNKQIDKFSQEPKLSTGFMALNQGANNVSVSLDADSKEVNLFFTINGTGDGRCFDDASTVTITFDGKQKTTFKNNGAMNCDGYFQMTFKNATTTPAPLQRLITKKITAISLNSSNKATAITLTDEQTQAFASIANCLVKEAKNLLKTP